VHLAVPLVHGARGPVRGAVTRVRRARSGVHVARWCARRVMSLLRCTVPPMR